MPDLRSLRLSHGMTLVQLARMAGIPARTLGALEYGQAHLDADSCARLARSLGVAPELLVVRHNRARPAIRRRALPWPGLRSAAPLLLTILMCALLLTHAP